MTIDPQNLGQQLRIFTITEDSSIDGLVIGPGQKVILVGNSGHTVTFTNFSRDLTSTFDRSGMTTIGLSGYFVEIFSNSLICYNGDVEDWRVQDSSLKASGGALGVSGGTDTFSNGNFTINGILNMPAFTLATLPAIVDFGVILVNDATGGQTLCFSDTTNWISVKTGIPVA